MNSEGSMKEINDTNPIQTNIGQNQFFPTQSNRTTNNVGGHQYTELDSDLLDESGERLSFIHERFENLSNFEQEATRELIGTFTELVRQQTSPDEAINEMEDYDNFDDFDINEEIDEIDDLLDLEIGSEINELEAVQAEQEETEQVLAGTEQVLAGIETELIGEEKEALEIETEIKSSQKKEWKIKNIRR